MAKCLCCSGTLLRHVRQGRVYWFCRHCWQEVSAQPEEYLADWVTAPLLAAIQSPPATLGLAL